MVFCIGRACPRPNKQSVSPVGGPNCCASLTAFFVFFVFSAVKSVPAFSAVKTGLPNSGASYGSFFAFFVFFAFFAVKSLRFSVVKSGVQCLLQVCLCVLCVLCG